MNKPNLCESVRIFLENGNYGNNFSGQFFAYRHLIADMEWSVETNSFM